MEKKPFWNAFINGLDLLNRFNTLLILILTVIATSIAWKSCDISKDMLNDHSQIGELRQANKQQREMLSNQQSQINAQNAQLNKLNEQTILLIDLIKQSIATSTNTGRSAGFLAKELQLLVEQQLKQIQTDSLVEKSNVIKLKYEMVSCKKIELEHRDNLATKDSLAIETQHVKDILDIFKLEITNPVIFEDKEMLAGFTETILSGENLLSELKPYEVPYVRYRGFDRDTHGMASYRNNDKEVIEENMQRFYVSEDKSINSALRFLKNRSKELKLPIDAFLSSGNAPQ